MPQSPTSAIRSNDVKSAPVAATGKIGVGFDSERSANFRARTVEMATEGTTPPDKYTCEHLENVALSCDKEEYFQKSAASIRVEFGAGLTKHEFDPIGVMKDGVMVLYFDPDACNFGRRVLKVDDQLRFLYIMDHFKSHQNKETPINRRVAGTVVVIPLLDVHRIYDMDDAMHICEKNGCSLDASKLHSVFIIQVDPSAGPDTTALDIGEEMISMDGPDGARQLFIFLASPEQQLRMCIKKCKDFTLGKTKDPTTMRKRVDQIGLQECDELLERNCPDIRFDVSYMNEPSLREITLCTDSVDQQEICCRPDMGGVMQKLEQELLPIDFARVYFALQDTVQLRRALTGLTSDCFKRGIVKFLQESPIDLPCPDSWNLVDSAGEVDQLIRILNSNSLSSAQCRYQESSTRAAIFAIRHMFTVEQAFNTLTGMGADHAITSNTVDGADEEDEKDDKAVDGLSNAKWRCQSCKFINDVPDMVCSVCKAPVPQKAAAAAKQLSRANQAPESAELDQQKSEITQCKQQ